ncbi:MAG: hypothetical protein H8E25_08455 [Planctomycetes bacterium]|nr:hypothetical protein [Planctomycetota bacterium]
MEFFFIAYLAMLVFLFTKLRRLQHSAAFQAAFGLLILVPVLSVLNAFDWLNVSGVNLHAPLTQLLLALSMFNLGRALFQQPDSK